MNWPLMTRDGMLRSDIEIASIQKKNRLHKLGFHIPRGKVTARQAVMLNVVEEDLPSVSDVAKADDIEPEEITENVARSMENPIAQPEREPS